MTDVSTANTVSAGWGSDLRIAAVAAMAPFLAGVLVLLGYLWLGGFGIVLGLGGAIGWAVWWYRKHGKFFPREVDRGAFGITVVITVVALVITLLAM